MKLIVGLGNPGPEYRDTRHNVGFMVADALVDRWRVSDQWREKFEALLIKTMVGEESVVLAKPLTFMNLSGQAVAGLAGMAWALPLAGTLGYIGTGHLSRPPRIAADLVIGLVGGVITAGISSGMAAIVMDL